MEPGRPGGSDAPCSSLSARVRPTQVAAELMTSVLWIAVLGRSGSRRRRILGTPWRVTGIRGRGHPTPLARVSTRLPSGARNPRSRRLRRLRRRRAPTPTPARHNASTAAGGPARASCRGRSQVGIAPRAPLPRRLRTGAGRRAHARPTGRRRPTPRPNRPRRPLSTGCAARPIRFRADDPDGGATMPHRYERAARTPGLIAGDCSDALEARASPRRGRFEFVIQTGVS
jgi:hypothetical protein